MVQRVRAALLLLPFFAAAAESEGPSFGTVLDTDGECHSEDEACALSALQLHGQKLATDAKPQKGTCEQYACHKEHRKGQSCQCNPGCESHSNCCADYETHCLANAPAPPAPAAADEADTATTGSPAKGRGLSGGRVYGHPDDSKAYPEIPGFTLTLVEEFDAPIDLDSDPIWTWSDGGLSEGQVRFQKGNIQFSDGKMLVVVSDTPASSPQRCSHAEVAVIPDKPLSSGEIRTRHNLFRYGRYEVRMKAPSVQPGDPTMEGNFISTMFVFRDAKYKHWREIDFELTGDEPGAVTTNVLSADNTDRWLPSIQESQQVHVSNARKDFHTYAFEWLPNSVTWYIDGRKIREKRGGGVRIPDKSGKIMMNLWVFGETYGFGGPHGENNVYPMQAEYDWFRFYRWNGETQYPCDGLSTSCLTDDDKYLSSNNPCDGIPQVGTVYGKAPCQATCR
jgi:endo-1,3-1,4-beta-glycanase ExoK